MTPLLIHMREYDGHLYTMVRFTEELTWDQANDYSLELEPTQDDWHLATLTSQEETDALTRPILYGGDFWIGLFQRAGAAEPDGGWRWVTGEKLEYTNWDEGEPNNFAGIENHGEFLSVSGKWNDEHPDHDITARALYELDTDRAVELSGFAEADLLVGGARNDTLKGNEGDDTLQGNNGKDKLSGDDGNDLIEGGKSKDKLKGGNGNDVVDGGAGSDRISGGKGSDELIGGNGKDKIKGGGGRDTIIGGKRNDVLEGNGGDDQLTGGSGGDNFVFRKKFGTDTVTDFDASEDLVRLSGGSEAGTEQEFLDALTEDGANVIYDFGGDGLNVIVFLNAQKSDFDGTGAVEFF